MSTDNLHIAWAKLLMRGLAGAGVRHVVVSPGSRSTPLVLAAGREDGLTCHTVIDERSAAFFALGQVRATGIPTALLCTSGTAPAHYLPAIIEASESFLPLVVITADRPWEAYDVASPQTTDQVKLFGDHVRHFADLGLPDRSSGALRAVMRIAAQAVHRASEPTPGPVHLNVRFRKPLEPVDQPSREPWDDEVDALLRQGPPRVIPTRRVPDENAVAMLAQACAGCERGIIACGPASMPPDPELRTAVLDLARSTGFPVFAEATSQVRFGPRNEHIIGGFDAILRNREWTEPPDVIIELGSTPISSAYASLVEQHASVPRWIVAGHGWHDPFNSATTVLQAQPSAFATALAGNLGATRSSTWLQRWVSADARVWGRVERDWASSPLNEAVIAGRLRRTLRDGTWLVAGNSSPVRDLDTYGHPAGTSLRVLHQRGVSGIDGLVSGAAGTASVSSGPVVLYVGDVSLLHDLTGLMIAASVRQPLIIVAVQNDGGRIFEQLPLGRRSELVEPLREHFVVPHGLSFGQAARQFGVGYHRVTTAADFDRALMDGLEQSGCSLIEAVVPPTDGVERRNRLWRDISQRLGVAR